MHFVNSKARGHKQHYSKKGGFCSATKLISHSINVMLYHNCLWQYKVDVAQVLHVNLITFPQVVCLEIWHAHVFFFLIIESIYTSRIWHLCTMHRPSLTFFCGHVYVIFFCLRYGNRKPKFSSCKQYWATIW